MQLPIPLSDTFTIIAIFCIAVPVFILMIGLFAILLIQEQRMAGLTWKSLTARLKIPSLKIKLKKESPRPKPEPVSKVIGPMPEPAAVMDEKVPEPNPTMVIDKTTLEPASAPTFDEAIPERKRTIQFPSIQRVLRELWTDRRGFWNWLLCYAAASLVAWQNYNHMQFYYSMSSTSLYPYFLLLDALSPACLGIIWLKMTGLRWRHALLLLILVPAALGGAILGTYVAGMIAYFAAGMP